MCKGKGKAKKEKKMAISQKRIEKIRKELEEVDALKEALGIESKKNPHRDSSDFAILVHKQLGDIGGKMWWLLGFVTVATGLLIAILCKVLVA